MSETSILVVDTDNEHRQNLLSILESQYFNVTAVANSIEARAVMDGRPPDLVIMDDSVKGLTPMQMNDLIQDRDLDAFTIVISENADLEHGVNLMLSGVFAFLAKPVESGSMMRVINAGLENKEAYHQVVSLARELKSANQALEKEKTALKEKTDELRFLYELGNKLSTTLNAREIISIVGETLSGLLGADLVAALTIISEEEPPHLYTDRAVKNEVALSLIKNLSEAMPSNHFSLLPDILPHTGCNSKTSLGKTPEHKQVISLKAAGLECGVLGVFYFNEPSADDHRMMILDSVALQSAQALFNAYQHETALKLASHDPLTGLFNRRAFEEALKREFKRLLRYGTDLSLIMIDLDHFKKVNDRFGHAAGDEVLRSVAGIIRENVRSTDIIARLGGEEFSVILPNTRQNMAYKLSKRIEKALNKTSLRLGNVELKQTVSQGVADTRTSILRDPDDLLRLADKAMYMAKEEGRNCIRKATDLEIKELGKDNLYACRQ